MNEFTNWRNRFPTRIRALFSKRQLDVEMDEETRSRVAMRTQQNIEGRMSPEEARYAALRRFGHPAYNIAQSGRPFCRPRVPTRRVATPKWELLPNGMLTWRQTAL